MKKSTSDPLETENKAFLAKAEKAFQNLFGLAQQKNELHFAFSLNPEFRGLGSAAWSTARETFVAFDEYLAFIRKGRPTPLKARVALAFYCHLAEANGFYEIPKNMMRIIEGKAYSIWPFQGLVETHRLTGEAIAPNSNKVFRDLAGHAQTLGLFDLAEVFRDAFDPDLRNGYAHADYIIADEGIRLAKRHGGKARTVSWALFQSLFNRGINFFQIIRSEASRRMKSYNPAKQIQARLDSEPEGTWTIKHDPQRRSFSIFK